jgi:hypothetical protein
VGCPVGVVFEGYFSGDGRAMNLTATYSSAACKVLPSIAKGELRR